MAKIIAVVEGHYISFKNGNLVCDCYYSSIYPDAWKKGEKLCRHLKEYIKNEKNKNK